MHLYICGYKNATDILANKVMESFSFRYPKDKQGSKNLEGLSHINIRNLAEKINLLSEQLDKFVFVIDMLKEWQDEMRAEYSP